MVHDDKGFDLHDRTIPTVIVKFSFITHLIACQGDKMNSSRLGLEPTAFNHYLKGVYESADHVLH
jgi:hypothetical protein